MTHFSLSTNVNPVKESETDSTSSPCIPLATFLPIAEWRNLRHFGLSRFMVKQSDVLAFLSEMPHTLRSVELSYLSFDKSEGDYDEFLIDMRDQLGWRERTPKERPRITVNIDEYGCGQTEGNPIDISREVDDFVYGYGENPFDVPYDVRDGPVRLSRCKTDVGMQWDPFEPESRWPNIKEHELQRLGYLEKDEEYFALEKWNAENGRVPPELR